MSQVIRLLSDPNISPEEILARATAMNPYYPKKNDWFSIQDFRDLGGNPSLDLLCLAEPRLEPYRLYAVKEYWDGVWDQCYSSEYPQVIGDYLGWAKIEADRLIHYLFESHYERLDTWCRFLWQGREYLSELALDLKNAREHSYNRTMLGRMVCCALLSLAGGDAKAALQSAAYAVRATGWADASPFMDGILDDTTLPGRILELQTSVILIRLVISAAKRQSQVDVRDLQSCAHEGHQKVAVAWTRST